MSDSNLRTTKTLIIQEIQQFKNTRFNGLQRNSPANPIIAQVAIQVKNTTKTNTNCRLVREYNFIFIDLRENMFDFML